MYEVPKHFLVPLNADGQGPADPDETVRYACSCGAWHCMLWDEKIAAEEAAEELDAMEGCPDCGGDSLALMNPLDPESVYCTNPRCRWSAS